MDKQDKKNLKILVMDDEQGIRDVLSYELGLQGYTVVTAKDGMEGLEIVRKGGINLVISDIKMPKMDGIKTLEEIKKVNSEIEVIMATGFGTVESAVDSMKKGAYDFIQKPFNMDEIVALIEKALEKAELKSLIALYETSRAIFSAVKLDELLPILVKLSMDLLKADDVSIMLMGEDKKLYIATAVGLDDAIKRNVRLAMGERIAGKIAEKKDCCVIVGPASSDPRFEGIEPKDDIKSSVICSLVAKNEIIGALCVSRTKNTNPFNAADKRYANIFSSQISQAIENARLYNTLEIKIKDLNVAYDRLSQMQKELLQAEKLAAIGELASGVAHELNNPLTVVIGLVQLMIEEGGLAKEKKDDLETVKEQAERCRKIILNLLQFSRKHESNKSLVSLPEIVAKTLELIDYELKNSGVEVVKEYDPDIPTIEADLYQLQQVFLNIINNAFHSVKDCKNPKIVIGMKKHNESVRIVFADNGSGIPEGIIGKIFDPFFTTKGVKNGTGLGLSISYGIVKEHGGDIKVDSKLGEGTTFTVDLPIIKPIMEKTGAK